MGISFFACIYYSGHVQLLRHGSLFDQFWEPAGGQLYFLRKSYCPSVKNKACRVKGQRLKRKYKGKNLVGVTFR